MTNQFKLARQKLNLTQRQLAIHMFQKYKHKKTGKIIEAKKSINEFGEVEYCVYQESAGDDFWGQDYKEEDFLKKYKEYTLIE